MTFTFTRRQALLSAAALPAVGLATGSALAQEAPAPPLVMAKARGFRLGEIEGATLLAGTAVREEPHKIFGLNVSDSEFAAVSAANFIPTDRARFYFTPTVVKTGKETILFDTGPDSAGAIAALAEAGLGPQDVTRVVLTHMHGDHIGGLMTDGVPTYPNAVYVTGVVEYEHWAAAGDEGFDTKVRPLTEKMLFVRNGDSVAPGVTALAAFGHTPGHMTFMLESGSQKLLLMADLANHYVWSLAYPDWEVRYDADKTMAAGSRRRILDMLATERIPAIGYHMPFPAAGFVERREDGFRYVPVSYQLL